MCPFLQLHHVMGLIPLGIEQGETTGTMQHKLVVDLVVMHVKLLIVSVIGWRGRRALMNHHIGAIGVGNTGIKERHLWRFAEQVDRYRWIDTQVRRMIGSASNALAR